MRLPPTMIMNGVWGGTGSGVVTGEIATKVRMTQMSKEFLLTLGRGASEAMRFVIFRAVDP